MWKVFLSLAVGALVNVVFLGVLMSQEECRSVAEVREKAKASGASLVQVTGEQAIAAYVALFNSYPPQSSFEFTTVYLAIMNGGETIIVLGNGDRMCAQVSIPSTKLQELMDRVLGRGI